MGADKRKPAKQPLGQAIARAAKAYTTATAQGLQSLGLYPGQDRLLKVLSDQGPLTMRTLAEALGVKPPTVTRTINRMMSQNLIKRERSKEDARQTIITATPQGLKLIKKIDKKWARVEKQMVQALDEKEQKLLRKLLKKIG